MRKNINNRQAFLIAGIAASLLSACGNKSAGDTESRACEKRDVVAALSTLLGESKNVRYEYSDYGDVKTVEAARDSRGGWSIKYNVGDPSEIDWMTGVIIADGVGYVRVSGDTVDGLDGDEWVPVGNAAESGLDYGLADVMDEALTGSENVGGGVYQMGELIDFTTYTPQEPARVEGICEYKMTIEGLEPVVARLDDDGRVVQVRGNEGTTITVSYDEQMIKAPSNISDIKIETVEQELRQLAQGRTLEIYAQSFGRELTSMASFGQEDNPSDVNPRKASLLVTMMDVPVDPAIDVGSNFEEMDEIRVAGWDGNPIVVWDGERRTAELEQMQYVMERVEMTMDGHSVCVAVPEVANRQVEIKSGRCW